MKRARVNFIFILCRTVLYPLNALIFKSSGERIISGQSFCLFASGGHKPPARRKLLTIIEIIDTFTFYGLDVIALAAATCAIVQILKITLFKKCRKKLLTFLPFLTGGVLYVAYSALINLSFKYVLDNYVLILEHGFSVGALSTVIYVWYEQFVRGERKVSESASVIATLIEGYVPDEQTERIAQKIAETIEKDVTGDGAKKTAEILAEYDPEGASECDLKLLSRLIIETLARIGARKNEP